MTTEHANLGWPSSNHLLAGVPAEEQPALARLMSPVLLSAGQVLYEPGDPLTHVYLPTAGMISLVVVTADGRGTEAAAVGREGAVAMSASGYVDEAFTRYTVQIPGAAQRVTAAAFEDMVDMSVRFCSAVTRYREVFARTTLQAVACNALHDVKARCARWILTTYDRSESDCLLLTQEYLASMLGVKRNAVNFAARELQAHGLIEYRRGRVVVLDRGGLEQAACECYAIIRGEIAKLFSDRPSTECDD